MFLFIFFEKVLAIVCPLCIVITITNKNNTHTTAMKYYTFLIAMKDTNGSVYPHEVAAPSIDDAIKFLTNDTGMTYAYEIKPV